MITFDELNTQNHEITELSNVLLYLFADRAICDTKIANALFFKYIEKVDQHLGAVDHLYPTLLADPNQHTNNVANNFMSGEQQIKKIVAGHVKAWANKKKRELVIRNYEEFLRDTRMLFHLVLDRIQDETEHLYPLVRRMGFEG
uniref:Hemerythrin HHE cation binding domain-containing protein n=2 Tax=unclassified Candidatus Kentrum TaxID=2643149 RepID=A0A451AS65_9GAMM|nr:MAG: hypothetical protein BECKLPF1236B_GA0070989_11974 [Candidatus Kentron sp. LPFa]VFK22262.1 MAG: hypothetical protein BECKLPF1236A_GA0070988_103384 [Candidatus Kentron sp. LPFa]VFK35370.1 MAG: hypothetical protein BECKLPF1236C_GA0070990_103655 [Candidatus Kentron sp. LPFa]VFK68891.1 MAG: hypothetical protein BECKUNK1418G_GA0071005_12814 [Candidatus Kentron sp. UNK]VFK73745.1 MAG: hypothetical protein BECKUNK1418H_GA0071006_12714 [Candidatus Kentron sp. UNK]